MPDTPTRRVLMALHRWVGLVLVVYVCVLSVTGSLIVRRRELTAAWMPGAHEPHPRALKALLWTIDLHDNLLCGLTGRQINGVLALATLFVVVTGVVLWWPRGGRGWDGLRYHRVASRLAQLSQLHRLAGIWTLPLLVVWTLSAVYMGFPDPFSDLVELLAPPDSATGSPAESFLWGLVTAHFGRFGGLPVGVAWIVLGLVPAGLAVTGTWQWWLRRRVQGA
jgi:uncharacterized iron-regulated membrane protein